MEYFLLRIYLLFLLTRTSSSTPAIVNGGWGQWQAWNTCTRSCGGNGNRHRIRYCNNPAPYNGGSMCSGVISGHNYQYETDDTCAANDCPAIVNGGWGQWQQWTSCTRSCGGGGSKDRIRYCNNPEPSNGGSMCSGVIFGRSYQYETDNTCAANDCPDALSTANGSWSSWSIWSDCTKSCGNGNTTRNRTCIDPEPIYGTQTCSGVSWEIMICSIKICQGDEQTNLAVTYVGGAGGGSFALVIIIVISLVLVKKRQKKRMSPANGTVQQEGGTHGTGHIYSNDILNEENSYLMLIRRNEAPQSADTNYDELQVPNDYEKVDDNIYSEVDREGT